MKPSAKITVPEVVDKFKEYSQKPGSGTWGSLHIVLSDQNIQDHFVHSCLEDAKSSGDTTGAELAQILLQMSKSQRLKISSLSRTWE